MPNEIKQVGIPMNDEREQRRSSLSERIEEAEELERSNKNWLAERRAELTNRFGWNDEVSLNEALAIYQVQKRRIDSVRFDYPTDQSNFEMAAAIAVDAAETKLNSRVTSRRVRNIQIMMFLVFCVVVGEYIKGFW